MLIKVATVGPWQTNCYVVAQSAGSECVIVDPGQGAERFIEQSVREFKLQPVAVLLTHGHLDHIWSCVPVADGYDIPALIHTDDRHLLKDPGRALTPQTAALLPEILGSAFLPEPQIVRESQHGMKLDLVGLEIAVLHSPGHTRGSVMFVCNDDELFSGDTLFAGAIGRVDLPESSPEQMSNSLKTVVLPLNDELRVRPGHGQATTIGYERQNNPFLTALEM